jgi:hypothetical protein
MYLQYTPANESSNDSWDRGDIREHTQKIQKYLQEGELHRVRSDCTILDVCTERIGRRAASTPKTQPGTASWVRGSRYAAEMVFTKPSTLWRTSLPQCRLLQQGYVLPSHWQSVALTLVPCSSSLTCRTTSVTLRSRNAALLCWVVCLRQIRSRALSSCSLSTHSLFSTGETPQARVMTDNTCIVTETMRCILSKTTPTSISSHRSSRCAMLTVLR